MRMLGQMRRSGCSNGRCRLCHDEDTTRWRKRVEQRELRVLVQELIAEHGGPSSGDYEWADEVLGVSTPGS